MIMLTFPATRLGHQEVTKLFETKEDLMDQLTRWGLGDDCGWREAEDGKGWYVYYGPEMEDDETDEFIDNQNDFIEWLLDKHFRNSSYVIKYEDSKNG